MLQAFKDMMPQMMKRLGVSERNFEVMSLIESEVHKYSPKARVVAYKNDKIYVEVESSVHLYELSFRRREILKILGAIPGMPETELKIFFKDCARPSAADRMKSFKTSAVQRN